MSAAQAPGTVVNGGHNDQYISATQELPRRATIVVKSTNTPPSDKSLRVEANIALGERLATERFGQEQWTCLYKLGMRESGWDNLIANKSSGAYGIPQSLPASKLDDYGDRHDPEVQIRWMMDYVVQRYKTPCKALAFQIANNWY